MLIQPIDYFLVVWFALAALSTAYVAWDQYRNNPEPVVMKWGFILVTLYLGPIGLLLYVMADKEPRPGTHEEFIKPLWKQGIGSSIHCVAGDATGIIIAAVVVSLLGLPMWLDLIIEYIAGFAVGLFIFQALFMKNMMGGTYWENVRKSFTPEFISMNFMMAGMAPVMTFLMMGRDMRAMEPTELLFWGVMSLGVMAGFAFCYPVNVWMVKQGIKHGLMTQRGKQSSNQGHQHEMRHEAEGHHGHAAHPGSHEHDHRGLQADLPGTTLSALRMTRTQLATVAGISVLVLAIGMVSPANWVNMSLSARDVGGAIMPPGMIMGRDTPAAAMRDMAAIHPREVTRTLGLDTKGDTVLEPRLENGAKVFDIAASVIRWQILPNV